MRARWVLAIGAWTALAVVTTLLGLLVVDDVGERMIRSAGGSGSASGSAASADAIDAAVLHGARVLATPGGTVVAACDGARLTVRLWKPHDGYRTESVNMDQPERAEIRFTDDAHPVLVRVSCLDGDPRVELG